MKVFLRRNWTTIVKYFFSLIFVTGISIYKKEPAYFFAGFLELALIFTACNQLIARNKRFGILNNVLLLIVNVQCGVLFFGNNYVNLVMLQNLNSIQDISGGAVRYIVASAAVIAISFLPNRQIECHKLYVGRVAPVLLLLEVLVVLGGDKPHSPIAGLYELGNQQYQHIRLAQMASRIVLEEESEIAEKILEEEEIDSNATAQHGMIGSDVNIILLFIEGLSENIIFDEREIMPNLKAFSEQCIRFENYYNHTFATYRGLQGQLYSGYSYNDLDSNKLTSLMDVLREDGYYSLFVNTEPYNEDFTHYLNQMSFDQVVSDASVTDGEVGSVSDRLGYERTLLIAETIGAEKSFISCYLFGTHATLDSVDKLYGYGYDAELNKFYNNDYWFGEFFKAFLESDLAENTVLIVTADHCTYADEEFTSAFPNYERLSMDCDKIPLYIYYQGMTDVIDAEGRNSLDLAPTILDLLGLESAPDFLGESLFQEKGFSSEADTYFWDPAYLLYTGNDTLEEVSLETREQIMRVLGKYFAKK